MATLDPILDGIRDAIHGAESRSNYACGGSLQISDTGERKIGDYGASKGPITCPPITLRWDTSQGSLNRVQFPPPTGGKEQYISALAKLVDDCASASFGRHGKDVYDEAYRKATKLDHTQSAVDFTPYNCGIISAIVQTILPGFAVPKLPGNNTALEHIGVVAELYKLNVNSTPSGMFKAHVDTPPGATQLGSLVVCLPCQHQGGGLKGHEIVYDWSNDDAASLQWAAFYSDVEHEVNPVTAGHRITLTYYLYISEHIGGIVHPLFPSVNPALYPLYKSVEKALEHRSFMPNGGILGFNCCHKYAHTDYTASERLPFALKGIDVAIFSIFSDPGLEVRVQPMVYLEPNPDYDEEEEEEWDSETQEFVAKDVAKIDRHRFGKFSNLADGGMFEERRETVLDDIWPHTRYYEREISWLNDKQSCGDANIVYVAHGNEASLNWFYTTVAILIEILK